MILPRRFAESSSFKQSKSPQLLIPASVPPISFITSHHKPRIKIKINCQLIISNPPSLKFTLHPKSISPSSTRLPSVVSGLSRPATASCRSQGLRAVSATQLAFSARDSLDHRRISILLHDRAVLVPFLANIFISSCLLRDWRLATNALRKGKQSG